MQKTITLNTKSREELLDITEDIKKYVESSDIMEGIVNIYALHSTAAIMIQENWDNSIQKDVINLFQKLIPKGVWEHDKLDNNGDSHLKAGIVGPSENIPIIGGKLGLSQWQNIFFCEFDGPRNDRKFVITIIENK